MSASTTRSSLKASSKSQRVPIPESTNRKRSKLRLVDSEEEEGHVRSDEVDLSSSEYDEGSDYDSDEPSDDSEYPDSEENIVDGVLIHPQQLKCVICSGCDGVVFFCEKINPIPYCPSCEAFIKIKLSRSSSSSDIPSTFVPALSDV